jgi:hypothetical protein
MSSTGRGRPVGDTRGVGTGFADPVGGAGPWTGAIEDAAATSEPEAAGCGGALAESGGAGPVAVTHAEGVGADAVDAGMVSSPWWVAYRTTAVSVAAATAPRPIQSTGDHFFAVAATGESPRPDPQAAGVGAARANDSGGLRGVDSSCVAAFETPIAKRARSTITRDARGAMGSSAAASSAAFS